MRRRTIAALLFAFSVSSASNASSGNKLPAELEKFKALDGRTQVARVFKALFDSDVRLSFEKVLIASADPSINEALANEAYKDDIDRARYAIRLICLRARFIPQSEFPISQINASYFDGRDGRLNPFQADLDRVGKEAKDAVASALRSPNAKLRNTTKVYSGALEAELAPLLATEQVKRWRADIAEQPCRYVLPAEHSYFRGILERLIVSKGLDSVVEVTSLLKKETDPEAREQELEILHLIDSTAVRLRASAKGQAAIEAIKDAVLNRELRICGRRLYAEQHLRKSAAAWRSEWWQRLEDEFAKDRFDCSSWRRVVALGLDQIYGDGMASPLPRNEQPPKSYSGEQPLIRTCALSMMNGFISYLTRIDPTFPSWEFPSAGSEDDMLHTKFQNKLARYHEAFVQWQQSVGATASQQ